MGVLAAHRSAGLYLRETAKALLPVLSAVAVMALAVAMTGVAAKAAGLSWLAVFIVKVFVGAVVYLVASMRWLKHMIRDDVLTLLPSKMAAPFMRFLA